MNEFNKLSDANNENLYWSLQQLKSETADLNLAIRKFDRSKLHSEKEIRSSLKVVSSRIGAIASDQKSSLFRDSEVAIPKLNSLKQAANDIEKIIDNQAQLNSKQFNVLSDLMDSIHPEIKLLALIGRQELAKNAANQKLSFTKSLKAAGGVFIAFILGLIGLLLTVDRMLTLSRKQDSNLLEASKRQKSIISASLDAIISANEAGEIIEYNESAENLFGWSRGEMIGTKMADTIIPKTYREAHNNGMTRYLKTRKPNVVGAGRIELSAVRKTGEEFPVELNITSVEIGESTEFIAYLRDISERKISEKTLVDAKERAERTDQAKSQFLSVMSHEMRTPLNGILGTLELLQTTKLTKTQARYVNAANTSGEILLEHINEALDITRIEMGNLELKHSVFSIEEVMKSVSKVLMPLADEKNLSFSIELDPSVNISYQGDPNRIRQILTNLIGNAIKFTKKGEISISVIGIHGPAESSLEFIVKDTGHGIEQENLERIFENFTSLAHSYGRQKRSDGLGLSIARKISRQMGGEITVSSEVGVGSTFTLQLPLVRSIKNSGSHVDLPEDATPIDTSKTRAILVVEDNDINRSILRDMLEKMGHLVTEASNGKKALSRVDEDLFDLILMDLSMPEIDGLEATKLIRDGDSANKNTVIIGLTAHIQEEYQQKAKDAGMQALFTKPIRIPTLQKVTSGEYHTAEFRPSGETLDIAAVSEMLSTIGEEKVKASVKRFNSELNEFADTIKRDKNIKDKKSFGEAIHKLRGAAAMLGMVKIEIELNEIEASIDNTKSLSKTGGELKKLNTLTQEQYLEFIEIKR